MDRVLAGKYELREQIGQGGSGIVYLAWDRHLECPVAVKAEKLPEDVSPEDISDEGILRKEMGILKTLNHFMLPAVHDFFCEDRRYLVMEYIQGESLHNYIEREGAVPEKLACKWGMQLLELLSYLHGKNPPVIYRDLKPRNIIVCPDGNLRVVDFGAAFCFRYEKRIPDQLAGTIGYAAPEQLTGINVDVRSDIYTFGATMYHMLTGFDPSMPPYGVRPVRLMNPEVTAGLEQIIAKCTEAEPARRYPSSEEVKTDLNRAEALGKRRLFPKIDGKKQSIIRKVEKKIWLTEKKTKGLFGIGILLGVMLFGGFFLPVKGREAPLPVVVYNNRGQKLLIRYDSVYTPEGNLILELEKELFEKEGIQKLSVSLTDCTTGEMQERIIYLSGGSNKKEE